MPQESTTSSGLINKTCSKCKLSKSISEFNFKHKASGLRQSYCKECGKELTRNH